MSLPVFPSVIRGLGPVIPKSSSFNTIVQSAPNFLDTTVSQARNPRWSWELTYNYSKDYQIQAGQNYTDYRILQDFLLSLAGSGGEFFYTDPTDCNLGPNNTATQAHLQLVTDGAGNWYSPIQRNFGGTFYEDVADLNGSIAVYANGTLQTLGANPTGSYQIVGPGVSFPGYSFMGLAVKWNLPVGLGAWAASTSYALNAEILDPNGHIQKVTTAGTSGASIPTFNDSGSTTTDNTVTWTDQGYNPSPATPITAQAQFYFRCRVASDDAKIDQFMQSIWTYGGPDSQSGAPLTIKTSPPVQV